MKRGLERSTNDYSPPTKIAKIDEFMAALEKAKKLDIADLEQEDVDKLVQLAAEAEEKGDMNAFYELGFFFEKRGQLEAAFQIYENVSSSSPHYVKICLPCAENRFTKGLFAQTFPEKKEHYRRSLEYVFQLEDRNAKLDFIRRIHNCVCTSPELRLFFLELLPVEWLDWLCIMLKYNPVGLRNNVEMIEQIFKDIFALKPGVLLEYPPMLYDLELISVELIEARNSFFTALENAKLKGSIEHKDVELLLNLANEAEEQGYVNAFYDLGHFIDIFSSTLGPVADEVFEHVTSSSSYYEWVCIRLAENKFNMARFDSTQRNALMHDSLKLALNIKDNDKRFEAIQRVALLYIFGTQYSLHEFSSDQQLLLRRDRDGIDSYFQCFDEMEKSIEEDSSKSRRFKL